MSFLLLVTGFYPVVAALAFPRGGEEEIPLWAFSLSRMLPFPEAPVYFFDLPFWCEDLDLCPLTKGARENGEGFFPDIPSMGEYLLRCFLLKIGNITAIFLLSLTSPSILVSR